MTELTDESPPAEPVRHYYGDGTYRARLDLGVRVEAATSVWATVDRGSGQALVNIGGVRIYGTAPNLRTVDRALRESLTELDGFVREQEERAATDYALTRCEVCGTMHSPDVPHATFGRHSERAAAYEIARRSFFLKEPELVVDSAALWVTSGDMASALTLLCIWVDANVAHEILDVLVKNESPFP